MKENCSYCGKILTDRHTFSYGIPGVKQVFMCSRWWCRLLKRRGYCIQLVIVPFNIRIVKLKGSLL